MKTQMKFQKWLCLILVILGALLIVYACLWKTGMLAALGTLCSRDAEKTTTTGFSEAALFYDTDPFNTALLWLGIAALLSACLLYVFANHKRRNYYVTNYVVSILVSVVFIGVSVVTMVYNGIYLGDLADLKANTTFMTNWQARAEDPMYSAVVDYTTSTGMFVFGYIVCALLIVGAVFLLLNMFWKRKLMQGEKKLLERSFAEEVA